MYTSFGWGATGTNFMKAFEVEFRERKTEMPEKDQEAPQQRGLRFVRLLSRTQRDRKSRCTALDFASLPEPWDSNYMCIYIYMYIYVVLTSGVQDVCV